MSDDYTNQEPVTPHTYTTVDDGIVVCNDCGAWAETADEVVHYPTCKPGESDRWQQWYAEEPPDDDPNPYEGTYSEE